MATAGKDAVVEQSNAASASTEGLNTAGEDENVLLPEKLKDDEEQLYWWEHLINLFPCLRHVEDRRRVHANDLFTNRQYKYADNYIKTSKYNIITFLPLNLLEQFLRVANFYFLILVILQSIPNISSVPVASTAVPLLIVLGTTAFKDAFDDIKRHISDHHINSRPAMVLQKGTENVRVKWKDVRVGNVLRLENNEFITADLLLISSSEPNGLTYIETAELDGETNLKVKQAMPDLATLQDDEEKLADFDGYVECDPPNNKLHKFEGVLTWQNKEYSLNNDMILLRGCRLRNTEWMYGLVIYAGHDTKLVKNSGRSKFKRTHIDALMNKLVLLILLFLGACLIVTFIGSLVFEILYGEPFQVYIPFDTRFETPIEIALVQIISNLIVLNTFIPISLYVSVEFIRLGLSFIINWDCKMYYEPNDVPAVARTTTLNEELGQIEYIFSDKTGTLTQNVMTFRKCTINGTKYGDQISGEPIDLSKWNSYAEDNFEFYDSEMIAKCREPDPAVEEFFKLVCLCHTVLPAQGPDGKLQYNAQSPDEAALVSAARNFGYVFTARSPFTVTLDLLYRETQGLPSSVSYDILNILDFNNERKRMSVIVREPNSGKITLYCKGADTVMFERLNSDCLELKEMTKEHLGEYGREGLRTLVLGKKEIEQEYYEDWAAKLQEATLAVQDREQKIDTVYNMIEQDLTLLGATAIEDKLQDGVPDTIANLAKANIKIWVLTGDKQETAINIGYSCKLLTEEMKVFIVDAEDKAGVMEQLQTAHDEIMRRKQQHKENMDNGVEHTIFDDEGEPLGPPFGIVLNGHSLYFALKKDMELLLLDTASECKAVICCRVTPLQKKRVVDLVKVHKKAVTLAIGDGANDVGMIKAAHIGVGISGLEGQQAVLSSDYSFGQFRFLERLLLVHGRWSYHRMTLFLKYFFYKNFAFTFSQFLFAFFCGFTAQTLYNPTYIAVYNVIYTSLPIIVLGVLDQDVTDESCLKYPRLYIAGQQNKRFNVIIFLRSLVRGIYVAIVVFFVLFGITYLNVYDEGYEWDYQSFGYAASGALTLIVNLQIALDTNYWNPVIHLTVWGSILIWLVVPPILSNWMLFYRYGLDPYFGVANEVLASGNFWFYCILSVVVALFPVVLHRMFSSELIPTLLDDVKLAETNKRQEELKDKFKEKFTQKVPPSLIRSTDKPFSSPIPKAYRSSYAFSHEEGFADLIVSGRYIGAAEADVTLERGRRRSTWMGQRPDIASGTISSLATAVAVAVSAHQEQTIPESSADEADIHRDQPFTSNNPDTDSDDVSRDQTISMDVTRDDTSLQTYADSETAM